MKPELDAETESICECGHLRGAHESDGEGRMRCKVHVLEPGATPQPPYLGIEKMDETFCPCLEFKQEPAKWVADQ